MKNNYIIKIFNLWVILIFSTSLAQLRNNENYTYSKTCLNEDCSKTALTVAYSDGLGKIKQVVNVKASPTEKDIVNHFEYDSLGRQTMNFLPIPQIGTTNGEFYSNPLANASLVYSNEKIFSETVFDKSPIGKVNATYSVGNAWSNHPKTFQYDLNVQNEVKKYSISEITWVENRTETAFNPDGYFDPKLLYKTEMKDEDGNTNITFTDAEGKIILSRKIINPTETADTYFIYNQYGLLVYKLPPMASALGMLSQTDIDKLCYQYRYDPKGRQVEKKLPGKGWEHLVYDKQDRLVMTQDQNMRSNGQWLFTKYDQFGRVAYTGITTGGSRSDEQNNVDGFPLNNVQRTNSGFSHSGITVEYTTANTYPTAIQKLLSVNYYDTYPAGSPALPTSILEQSVLPQSGAVSTKTMPTTSLVNNLESNGWTKTYILYDMKARAIGNHSYNYLGGYTKTETLLNFVGLSQKSVTYHKRQTSDREVNIVQEFLYDDSYRLLKHFHEVIGESPKELLAQYRYKENGELANKKVGGTETGYQPLQDIDYQYNIRGQLTGINTDENGIFQNGKLFNYKINYNNPLEGLAYPNIDFTKPIEPRYNGNIAEISWRSGNDTAIKRYGFVYDGLNRLEAGLYQNPQNPGSGENSELIKSYDLNGNILKLDRFAGKSGTTATKIDELTYIYNGDRVTKITDAKNNTNGYPGGGNPISYDANGNMLSMMDKGIAGIDYNLLNLPKEINQNGNTTYYTYRADGTKLKRAFTLRNASGNTTTTTDYLDGFHYNRVSSLSFGRAIQENDEATEDARTAGQIEVFNTEERGKLSLTSQLLFFPTAEGFYDYEKKSYIYQYKDHLGNVRLSYAKEDTTLKVLDRNDYYPFGMNHLSSSMGSGSVFNPQVSPLNYKYNGKELQETGMYDYGARMYMSDIGRWNAIDPLAEQMSSHSVYNYGFNNPIRFIDPDGRKAGEPMERLEGTEFSFPNGSYYNATVAELDLSSWMTTFKSGGGSGGSSTISTPGDNLALVAAMQSYGKGDWTNTGSGFSNMSSQKSLDYFGIELKEFIIPEVVLTGNSSTWGKQIQNHVNAYINQWNTEKASSTDWAAINKGLAGFGFGNSVKTELIEQAGKAGGLTKTTATYLKVFKGVGVAGGIASSTISGVSAYEYYKNGGKDSTVAIKAGLDITMTLIGTFGGPIGFGVSALYFVIDTSTDGFGGYGAH